MSKMKEYLSKMDLAIIIITAMLFVVALFVKGLTKDILLEAGVLLVSIKLIMMNYRTSRITKKILKELEEIKGKVAIDVEGAKK